MDGAPGRALASLGLGGSCRSRGLRPHPAWTHRRGWLASTLPPTSGHSQQRTGGREVTSTAAFSLFVARAGRGGREAFGSCNSTEVPLWCGSPPLALLLGSMKGWIGRVGPPIRLRPDWVRLMRNLCSWSASLLDWGGFASLVCPSRLTATIRIVSPHSSLSACSPGLPYLCHRQPCLGGPGETGLVGFLVMEGGGSQVDQETRTVHRGHPLFGVVQPPPSVNGGTCRVSSQLLWPLANRGGCLTCTFHYSASRIPYGPS